MKPESNRNFGLARDTQRERERERAYRSRPHTRDRGLCGLGLLVIGVVDQLVLDGKLRLADLVVAEAGLEGGRVVAHRVFLVEDEPRRALKVIDMAIRTGKVLLFAAVRVDRIRVARTL